MGGWEATADAWRCGVNDELKSFFYSPMGRMLAQLLGLRASEPYLPKDKLVLQGGWWSDTVESVLGVIKVLSFCSLV